MKHTRVIVTHYGGPDALRVVEEECPEPKSGEVRVRMHAAGVAIMKLPRGALLAQLSLTVYFQAVQWLPLGQWNYQPGYLPLHVQAVRGQLTLSGAALVTAFALPFAAYLIACRFAACWLKWFCLIGYAVWLTLQIKTWWVPYLIGASDRWVSTYERVFSHSIKLLPAFGRHLPPDGMHFVLQLLLLWTVVALGRELLDHSSSSKERRAA